MEACLPTFTADAKEHRVQFLEMNGTVVPQRRSLGKFPIAVFYMLIIDVGKGLVDVDGAVVPRVSQGTVLVQKRIPICQSGMRTAELLRGRLQSVFPDANTMTTELESPPLAVSKSLFNLLYRPLCNVGSITSSRGVRTSHSGRRRTAQGHKKKRLDAQGALELATHGGPKA